MNDGVIATHVHQLGETQLAVGDTIPSAREERCNALTHAAGFLLAAMGAVVLLSAAGRNRDSLRVAACAVYSLTMIAAYAASTLSHIFRNPRVRNTFRIADQALIFLFIAGSWTPVAAAWLRDQWWWAFHGAVWAVAIGGFVSKAMFSHRVTMGTVSTVLYVLLGWSPVLVAVPLVRALPAPLCLWLLAGGVCYTLGLLFFRYDDRVTYFHAAWHLLVIAGSACHYVGILNHCTAAWAIRP